MPKPGRKLPPEWEAYLRKIAAASDEIRRHHSALQQKIRTGSLEDMEEKADVLKDKVDRLLRTIRGDHPGTQFPARP